MVPRLLIYLYFDYCLSTGKETVLFTFASLVPKIAAAGWRHSLYWLKKKQTNSLLTGPPALILAPYNLFSTKPSKCFCWKLGSYHFSTSCLGQSKCPSLYKGLQEPTLFTSLPAPRLIHLTFDLAFYFCFLILFSQPHHPGQVYWLFFLLEKLFPLQPHGSSSHFRQLFAQMSPSQTGLLCPPWQSSPTSTTPDPYVCRQTTDLHHPTFYTHYFYWLSSLL